MIIDAREVFQGPRLKRICVSWVAGAAGIHHREGVRRHEHSRLPYRIRRASI